MTNTTANKFKRIAVTFVAAVILAVSSPVNMTVHADAPAQGAQTGEANAPQAVIDIEGQKAVLDAGMAGELAIGGSITEKDNTPKEMPLTAIVDSAAAQQQEQSAEAKEPELTEEELAAQQAALEAQQQAEAEAAALAAAQQAEAERAARLATTWTGSVLTRHRGVNYGPNGKETYYNLKMSGVVRIMRGMGFTEEEYPYWVREDGAKMLGDYVMVAANFSVHPRGTIVESSLGMSLVCDTGTFAYANRTQLDIATAW